MSRSIFVAAALALFVFANPSIQAAPLRGGALARPATPVQSAQPFGGVARFTTAFSPFTGNFVMRTPGTFNPMTGQFTLSGLGNSVLSSRRDLFLPTSGKFVPSPNGAFRLTTDTQFNPVTGAFTPTRGGTAVFSTRGNFVPATGGSVIANPLIRHSVFPGMNPFNTGFLSPFGHVAQREERNLLREERAAGLNPFTWSNSSMNSPYGSFPYSNPYSGSNGSASNGSGSNGSGGFGLVPYPTPATGTGTAYPATSNTAPQVALAPAVSPSATQGKQLPVLAAFGIPSELDEVQWPSAFRMLPPDKRELLPKLEAQLKIAATQAAGGRATPIVLREAKNTIDDLRDWLRERQSNMAENTNQDADRFLRGLNDSIHAMSP